MTTSHEPAGIIDTCITPFWRTELEAHEWMPEPWRSKRHLPGMLRHMFPAPTGIAPYGEYLESARPTAGGMPGSDIAGVISKMDSDGSLLAVLQPLTRGPQPDQDMATVLAAATNDWLAARWLGDPEHANRFLGSIKINPGDPDAAVREIERWSDHPRMVQVSVPMDAQRPYGQRNYFPIWEAAARYRLPVVVHADGGASANFKSTIIGFPRKHISYAAQEPTTFVYHAASFIMEGVLDRLPELTVFFSDGGHDLATTLMWRMDIDFGIARHEVPWMARTPGEYLDRFRFRTSHLEGPGADASMVPGAEENWLRLSRAQDLLVYGSNFPHWTTTSPAQLPKLAEESRSKVLRSNAVSMYAPRLEAIGDQSVQSLLGLRAAAR